MATKTLITLKHLRELLDYDPATGIFTRRVARGRTGAFRVGSIAGSIRPDGYCKIKIEGQTHAAHRLAWLYMHGTWPPNDIDHINCIRSDNRIVNLRLATHPQGAYNKRRYKNNTSGFKGVTWFYPRQKWMAQIKQRGKNYNLGLFEKPEDAYAAYCKAAVKLFGEFARTE